MLTSLLEQLPLLLVLSPAIGFVVTLAVARAEYRWARQMAAGNVICSLLIVGVAVGKWEMERSAEMIARQSVIDEDIDPKIAAAELESLQRKVDRQRAERLMKRPFAIDGTNLWAAMVVVLVTGVVVWRGEPATNQSRWFLPGILLFQSASLGAILAYDLRLYLITFQTGALVMSGLLGAWGGAERRAMSERYCWIQFCGSAFVMFGFAMLAIAVPWMKIEDSSTLPAVLFNIAPIVYEVRKWITGNELAFQYATETMPWIVLTLSIGFSIQFGLFPFHSVQVAVLSTAPRSIAALSLCGLSMASCLGWFRFVVPLAPELLGGFFWLMVIPMLAGAVWAALCSLTKGNRRQQLAFLYISLANLSLLGVYALTRAGLCGTWLLQQQLTVLFCWVLLAFDLPAAIRDQTAVPRSTENRRSLRPILLMLAIAGGGLFACASMLFAGLLRESLLIVVGVLTAGTLVTLSVSSLLLTWTSDGELAEQERFNINPFQRALLPVIGVALVVNLLPGLMLRQCEPEIARVFRPFEQSGSAGFAQHKSDVRQTSP